MRKKNEKKVCVRGNNFQHSICRDLLEFLNRVVSRARGEIVQLYICGFERLLGHIVLHVSLPYCSFTCNT